MKCVDRMIERWNSNETPTDVRLQEALSKLKKLQAERLKLDKRIHNQRLANRLTWEMVEMRRKWLGSDTARAAYSRLSIFSKNLIKENAELRSRLGPENSPPATTII